MASRMKQSDLCELVVKALKCTADDPDPTVIPGMSVSQMLWEIERFRSESDESFRLPKEIMDHIAPATAPKPEKTAAPLTVANEA